MIKNTCYCTVTIARKFGFNTRQLHAGQQPDPTTQRMIYVTGHSEYDPLTLKGEYDRDVSRDVAINIPANYYAGDDPKNEPRVRWRGHAHLLYSNRLNYHVYQVAPYSLRDIPGSGLSAM